MQRKYVREKPNPTPWLTYYVKNNNVHLTPYFYKKAKRLLKKYKTLGESLAALENDLLQNPHYHRIFREIDKGEEYYRIRWQEISLCQLARDRRFGLDFFDAFALLLNVKHISIQKLKSSAWPKPVGST